MNQKNHDYLKEGLKYLGFGESLQPELARQLEQQPPSFQLTHQTEFRKGGASEKMNYVLDFRKSETNDMYFFNSFKATIHPDNPDSARSQTFYINKNSGITAKEAYNLLDGRAVNKDLTNKEDKPYNAWLQLDFNEKDKHDNFKVKQFTAGYGFDLNQVLLKYPIKELANLEQSEKLLKSLHKGNLTAVTFSGEKQETKMYITANPQYKSLQVYDSALKRQFQQTEKKPDTPGQSHKKSDLEESPQKKSKRSVGI